MGLFRCGFRIGHFLGQNALSVIAEVAVAFIQVFLAFEALVAMAKHGVKGVTKSYFGFVGEVHSRVMFVIEMAYWFITV